jgi:pimeloyl-ACP methyl ester carboxylesterase
MARAYGTTLGAKALARVLGMPDAESRDAFVATAAATNPDAIRAIVGEVSEKPLPDKLEAISVPLLAVVGERDTQPAKQGVELLVRTVPGARGATVQGVGHQWNAESPEVFTEMVRAWVDTQEVDPRLTDVSEGRGES